MVVKSELNCATPLNIYQGFNPDRFLRHNFTCQKETHICFIYEKSYLQILFCDNVVLVFYYCCNDYGGYGGLKAKSMQGYWEELHHVLDRMRYFEAVPSPRFRTTLIKEDWIRFQAVMVSINTIHYASGLNTKHLKAAEMSQNLLNINTFFKNVYSVWSKRFILFCVISKNCLEP